MIQKSVFPYVLVFKWLNFVVSHHWVVSVVRVLILRIVTKKIYQLDQTSWQKVFIRHLITFCSFLSLGSVNHCQSRGRVATVNHGAQRIKAFISKSSSGNSVAASSVLMFRVTPFIN